MENNFYSSNKDFMEKEFPLCNEKISVYQKTTTTFYKEEVIIEKKESYNDCLHEHCVINDHLSIGKGKLTLVYRCLDCGECVLDCRSYLGGIAILTLAGTISKNTTINYQKVLGNKK